MTYRQRQVRKRRGRSRVGRRALLAFGVLTALGLIGVASVVGWIISVANDAPDITQLKPIDKGASSVVFAADGRSAIGIEAAAETYFGKHAKNLSLDQSALLAGLPQAPSQYNPFRNPNAALNRRNEVLNAMASEGYVTRPQAIAAANKPLG